MKRPRKLSFYLSPTITALLIACGLCFFFNFGMDTYATNPPTVQVEELGDLVQQIEVLQKIIKDLNKTIQNLNDYLDQITKMSKDNTTVTQTPVRKLRSPKQIDRTPVREEKTDTLIAKAKVALEEELLETICIELITTKKTSDFVKSMRQQVIEWLGTAADERTYDTPLSRKQFAWACYILHPADYPNPKTDRDLYPNG